MINRGLKFLLAVSTSAVAVSAACCAYAADADQPANAAGTGSAGSDVSGVIVTAERDKAAANAPTKPSLQEIQPEAIISRAYIEQAVSETGGWVEAASIAPSVSGITANGGGVGETTKLTMRGFQDGQFNLTYDGIAFGDTNGPTHHEASYWPASTIGAVVVDRGPGEAGDLGPANFGGAIHFFSADPSRTFGVVQKLTYGSFSTVAAVTTLNTGDISQLGGGRLLLNFDERNSAGELSDSGGEAQNQLAKFVLPINDKWNFVLFGSHNYTRFYQADAGPGATWYQVQTYGKNFALDANPADEHYYKYNYEGKQTDFEYADLKGEVAPTLTFEDQLYSYFYSNKTWATDAVTDPVAGDLNGPTKPNATSLINNPTGTESASDIGGYDKLNQYRVYGDIVRLNKDWGWGVLKMGGVYEWSGTHRFNLLEDFTEGGPAFLGGYPDDKFTLKKYPLLPATTNAKTQEKSAYQNWQVFADFELHPIQNLTLTPGVKYVHSNIQVNAADENVASASGATEYKNEPLTASNAYSSPVYFFTANYRIRPDLAAYGQVATSFLLPGLPDLYYQAASTQQLQPEKTTTYQGGLVYSHGNITADADVYRVDASNLQINCTIYTPTPEAATCNAGLARYTGVEGEAAYAFDFGLTLFANGSLMSAKQLANAANAAAGIAGNPAEELTNSPGWTDAIGGLYRSGRWQGSLTYKQSGAYVATYNGGIGNRLPGYDTFDGSVSYDFGHVLLKLQAFNLLDRRAITSFNGSVLYSRTDPGLYEFQAGRNLEATLIAKF